jgi:hypothetical protein
MLSPLELRRVNTMLRTSISPKIFSGIAGPKGYQLGFPLKAPYTFR